MKKPLKKIICIILSSVMLFSLASTAFADNAEYCPTIIIPGVFQSEVKLYNDDGTIATNKDGNAYTGPFYLDSTSEIVFKALKEVLFPLISVLVTQQDFDDHFAKQFASTICSIIGEKIQNDENGSPVYNLEAVHYDSCYSNCSEEDKQHILDSIPLQDYIDVAGGDNLYFYSYNSFGNINANTVELYQLIQTVKAETGSDKVNLVPISQGGTLCNNLLEYYPQVANDLNRLIYVVPAIDGTSILGDIFSEGLIDDSDALYGYMIPTLLGDSTTGNIINLALRILPNSVLNKMLDYTADELLGKYVKNSTMMWALLPAKDYEKSADKYLSGEENSLMRAQADDYHKAQLNARANILKMREAGVEVFDIVNYNTALYPLCDSWNKVNADGIIQLDSTSIGAYSAPVNGSLPTGYVQQGNDYGTCSSPETHNHIDSHNMVDASTGLLPDNTFFFYNGDHEKTASNDALIGLVVKLLTDDSFTDVYSYPEEFPQFNTARVTKELRASLAEVKTWDVSKLSAEDAAELQAAIEETEAMLANTNVDTEEVEKAETHYFAIVDKINGTTPETESVFSKALGKIVSFITKVVDVIIGFKGYSDAKIK